MPSCGEDGSLSLESGERRIGVSPGLAGETSILATPPKLGLGNRDISLGKDKTLSHETKGYILRVTAERSTLPQPVRQLHCGEIRRLEDKTTPSRFRVPSEVVTSVPEP